DEAVLEGLSECNLVLQERSSQGDARCAPSYAYKVPVPPSGTWGYILSVDVECIKLTRNGIDTRHRSGEPPEFGIICIVDYFHRFNYVDGKTHRLVAGDRIVHVRTIDQPSTS